MTRIRNSSPKFIGKLVAKQADTATLGRIPMIVSSRSMWVGSQDHESCTPEQLSQMLGFGLIDDAELRAAIAKLEAEHVIVDEQVAGQEIDAEHAHENAQVLEARAHLAAIARLADSVSGDVGGLGRKALPPTDGKLATRLAGIRRELEALGDELTAARRAYVAEQAVELKLAEAKDLKVHLGAGPTKLDGWINTDVFPAELVLNLTWGLPFADGSVAFAYAGHVFEHLYYGGQALGLLREVKRVLKPGGVFRFIVPDMGLFLRKYAEGNRAFFEHWKKTTVRYFQLFDTPMELIMMYCMVGREPSEFLGHKMGYDFETIEKLARLAGFSQCTRSDYMASEHPELRVDEVSSAAKLAYEGERYSLFVEMRA